MNYNLLYFLSEIILEQLPISSSGHMLLIQHITSSALHTLVPYLTHAFLLGIYIPFILMLIIHTMQKSIRLLFTFGFSILILCITTLICQRFLTSVIKYLPLPLPFPLWLGFFISALILYYIKKKNKGRGKTYYYFFISDAIFIGILQSVAFLPGISRMAIVLLGSILRGYTKENAFYIALISNACISVYSVLYIVYSTFYRDYIAPLSFSLIEIIYMQIAFFIAIVIFYIIKYCIDNNKISFLYKYEIFISFLTLYLQI